MLTDRKMANSREVTNGFHYVIKKKCETYTEYVNIEQIVFSLMCALTASGNYFV